MATQGITVLIGHRALPGHEDQARKELAQLVATVIQDEPECNGIEILNSVEDASRITLIEQWSGRHYLGSTKPRMRLWTPEGRGAEGAGQSSPGRHSHVSISRHPDNGRFYLFSFLE